MELLINYAYYKTITRPHNGGLWIQAAMGMPEQILKWRHYSLSWIHIYIAAF